MTSTKQNDKRSGLPGWKIALLGALASAGLMLIPRNNAMPAAVFAAGFGAICALIADWIVWSGLLRRWRRSRMPRLVLAGAIGCVVGSQFLLTGQVAFRRAFGMDIPPGVHGLTVEGYYSRGIPGGPSDLTIFLQFDADRPVLDRILSHREFHRLSQMESDWNNEHLGAGFVWRDLFWGMASAYAGVSWQMPPKTTSVEIHRWGEGTPRTTVLWDAERGRAYVLYTLG